MRRLVIGASTLAAALVLGAAPATAQFYVGGFATIPQSDYEIYAKTGWMVEAGYSPWRSADERFALWISGAYGSNTHEGDDDEKTNLFMGLAGATYALMQGSSVEPYLIGTVGYLSHKYDAGASGFDDETDGGLAFGGGIGLFFAPVFVEARYMTASINDFNTSFIMLGAGVAF